jgi:hypothetical protein
MTFHRNDTKRLAFSVGAGLSLVAGIRFADGASSCTASCVERMRACRAERCPASAGTDHRHCRDVCRAVTGCAAGAARIRTIASVVSECRSSGGFWTGRQRLEIRRGDCPPLTAMTIEGDVAAPDPLGICEYYGTQRGGAASMAVGALQGLAVSADGKSILFQVTDDFVGQLRIGDIVIPSPSFTVPVEGIFVVPSDGSAPPRRIAPQARVPPFAVRIASQGTIPLVVAVTNGFDFSPDGKLVVYTDRGPGPDGSDAQQLFILDVTEDSPTPRQLTRFTSAEVKEYNPDGISLNGVFIGNDRVGGFAYDGTEGTQLFTIDVDGTHFQPYEIPTGGGKVVWDFGLSGLASDVVGVVLQRHTDLPSPGLVHEIFVRDEHNVLQLTAMNRSDTGNAFRLRDREHIIFAASGDPVSGSNPKNTCQVFGIDRLAGHLRQLTHFKPDGTASAGCAGSARPPGCTAMQAVRVQDAVTGAIVFDTSCDPFGLAPVSQQVYAMRPDGSGFRQLTTYRGTTVSPDGTVTVELPGPIAYSARAL